MSSRLALAARTAAFLTREQLVYWPLRRLQAALPVPQPSPRAQWSDTRARRVAPEVAAWGPPDRDDYRRRAARVLEGRYRWLGHEEVLPTVDWTAPYGSRLWTYQLQYFDFALDLAWAARADGTAEALRRFEELALAWIEQTRGGRGPGWEPYPLSKRIINWCYVLLLSEGTLREDARRRIAESVALQLESLERRLELHLLANHLQKNYSALALGALLFDGPSAERWRTRFLPGIREAFLAQVHPDGVHAERSPMYHAIAMADLLEFTALSKAAGLSAPEPLVALGRRMREVAQRFFRPDGTLHLINDSAEGSAPDAHWLATLAERVLGPASAAEGPFAFVRGGFFGYSDGASGTRLIVDAGEPGPRHQPAHSHCGILGYELDLAGRPVITDSGLSGYDGDPYRAYVRSTRAHNTLSIDGLEQSEVWGTFRMARRATVVSAQEDLAGGTYRFSGAVRPYHTPGAVHRRTIERIRGGWRVTDQVEGAPGRLVESFIHLHPDFRVQQGAEGYVARSATLEVRLRPFGADSVTMVLGAREPVQGWYCPAFGTAIPAQVLGVRVERNAGQPFGYEVTVSA